MNGKPERGAVIFVDTNVIIESHRVGAWKALAGSYRVETVEDCVAETQTGFQWRRQEESIAVGALRETLAAEHGVGDRARAELAVRIAGIALDRGEESLWAYALGREDVWWLCGPDRASLRCGVVLGLRERIVSLQVLLEGIGHRPRRALKGHYTRKWQETALAELVFG